MAKRTQKKPAKAPAQVENPILTDGELPALYTAMSEQPGALDLRKIAADRFDEIGQHKRANYIRRSVELNNLAGEERKTEKEALDAILEANRAEWVRQDMGWYVDQLAKHGVQLKADVINAMQERANEAVFENGFVELPFLLPVSKIRENAEPLTEWLELIADSPENKIYRFSLKLRWPEWGKERLQRLNGGEVGFVRYTARAIAQADRLNGTDYLHTQLAGDEDGHTLITDAVIHAASHGSNFEARNGREALRLVLAGLALGGADMNRGTVLQGTGEEGANEDFATWHPLLALAANSQHNGAASQELGQFLVSLGADPQCRLFGPDGPTLIEIAENQMHDSQGAQFLRGLAGLVHTPARAEPLTRSQYDRALNELLDRCIEGVVKDEAEYAVALEDLHNRHVESLVIGGYTHDESRSSELQNLRRDYVENLIDWYSDSLHDDVTKAIYSRSGPDVVGARPLIPLRHALKNVPDVHLVSSSDNEYSSKLDEYLNLTAEDAHPAIVRLYLERGGFEINALNRDGLTVLDASFNDTISDILRSKGALTGEEVRAAASSPPKSDVTAGEVTEQTPPPKDKRPGPGKK